MASPEQIGEWLNEELNIERPVGEGRTAGVQLNDLVPEQHTERSMGDMEEIQQVYFVSSPLSLCIVSRFVLANPITGEQQKLLNTHVF